MIKLNEKHHAFISAKFYQELEAGGFDNFRQAFLLATRMYAEQRGSRMAQRAVRDGRPLNFASYRWYGEWVFTPEYLSSLTGEARQTVEAGQDYTVDIFECPWSDQYLSMGALEGANDYCSVLDESIARGFNPELTFIVSKTMHSGKDFCRHTQKCAMLGAEEAYGPRNPDNIRDFSYHCAHVYSTFSKMMRAIYGADGEALSSRVMLAFSEEYGGDAAAAVMGLVDTDFDYI